MSSKIEQMIDQIEDFIDSCRYQTFSKTMPFSKNSARKHRMRSGITSASSPIRKRSSTTPREKPRR